MPIWAVSIISIVIGAVLMALFTFWRNRHNRPKEQHHNNRTLMSDEQSISTLPNLLSMDKTAGPLWSRLESFGSSASLQSRFPRFVSCYPRLHGAIKQAFACALDLSTGNDKADVAIYGLGRLCLEDFTEIVFLVENDFGYAALKLLRGLYERVVVTETIIESPVEAATRFFDYYLVNERKWHRRAKEVYPGWNDDPSDLARVYDEKIDKFKYEPCATCGRAPQDNWTQHGLVALAGELGKTTKDSELRNYGKELRHLYLFCAERTNPHIHASMASIMERLSGQLEGQLNPGSYALCYAHLLLVLAIDAQNRRFTLGMESVIDQLRADRTAAWIGDRVA
jgi:hypothetical protein